MADRMAVPVGKLPQRSRQVEGRVWVDMTHSLTQDPGRDFRSKAAAKRHRKSA